MTQRLCDQLLSELSQYRIACDEHQAELLIRHLELVIEKNRVMNLTRITEPSEAVTLHIVDSLLPLAVSGLSLGSEDSLLDMGTGAGFPGIPLTIMAGCQATLVDSVAKKVNVVAEFATQLGLDNVSVRHARLEDLAREIPGSQICVTARAVAQTNVLVEYAAPLLKRGGVLVVEKGRPTDDELLCAFRAAEICGLEPVSRETFELPRDLGHREILLYRKVSKARIKLPRKTGEAKRMPLGIK